MQAVQIEKISLRYGDRTILRDIELSVAQGQYLVLLGRSGCGKTSLLRMIAGLLNPTDGRILIDGRNVSAVPPRRRDVAYVPQNDGLYPHQTVARSLAMGIREKLTRQQRQQRILEAAAMVGIDHLLDHLPSQLSGGQLRRAALAKAMVRQAFVRLLDEPLSAVDGPLRFELQQDLKRMHEASRGATIHVTHDPTEARQVADRIAVLTDHPDGGACIGQCSDSETLFRSPASLEVAAIIGLSPLIRHDCVHRNGIWFQQTNSSNQRLRPIAITGPGGTDGESAVLAYYAEHEIPHQEIPPADSAEASYDWIDSESGIRVRKENLFWFPARGS